MWHSSLELGISAWGHVNLFSLFSAYSNHVCRLMSVYELLRGAVTKCHRVGSLKQQKYVLSGSWQPEV